jgi:hypothetical protein
MVLDMHIKNAGAIAIPSDVHRNLSETFGGRNSEKKSTIDALNLLEAIHNNTQKYNEYFTENGISIEDIQKKLEAFLPDRE